MTRPGWTTVATSPQHLGPYVRVAFAGIGLVYLVAFTQPSEWGRSVGHRYYWYGQSFEEVWTGLLAGLAVLVLCGAFSIVAALRGAQPGSGWPTRTTSLVAAMALFGLGSGSFTAAGLNAAGEGGGLLIFLVQALATTVVLAATERGRGPLLALLVCLVVGTASATLQVWALGLSYYDDELVAALIFGLLLYPGGYLLLRGLLTLVSGRTGAASPLGAAPVPLEVLARDGLWLVRVEAPGLTAAAAVEVEVEGPRVRLRLPPPPGARSEALLFSTRRTGPAAVEVVLPRSVHPPPRAVEVADGLLTVSLTPRPAEADVSDGSG